MRSTFWKLVVVLAILLGAPAALADDIELLEARLEQTDEGVVLNADFAFDFNSRLEQAVTNGVPLYFVVEFELTQPRWYWFDERTATRRLQTRLSYHALSRHFRLSTGLLQQNYASLSEALAVLRRVRNWLVLDKSVPLSDANYQASVRMRLDLSLLPKPFQVNALTSREWHLESEWKRFGWRPGVPPVPPPPPQGPPPAPAEKREGGRRKMKTLLILGIALAGVLLFLLATASANTSLFAQHYSLLLGLNAVLAVALLALVGYQLVSLRRRLKRRVFGSRLTLRFLVLFAAMALVPGVLVYTVSVQFLSKSIESWFDVSVDSALEGGIKLGQAAIDQMLGELTVKARAMALELADRTDSQQVVALNRLRQQAGVEDAVVVAANGRLVASASDNLSQLVPELPSSLQLRQARSNRGVTSIDSLPGKPLGLRAIVPISASAISDETRYLQLRQPVPESLARSAESVEAVYGDYRKLSLSRQGLKRSYIVTLTLALLMALFSAVALAFILSDRISAPLSDLAQATQAVARGDFSKRMPVTSRDELGVLLESFNSMTRQLDEARRVVESNRTQLETAKARLENILANLSAGVLVFDPQLRLSIFNHGAAAILGGELGTLSGKALDDWGSFEPFANPVRDAFAAHGEKGWQLELVLPGTGKTLLARGTPLPSGYVLVFDDVTQLIQAQRATAWAEVARRLAHEIKNPLTPIQLSAERLEMKLADKLGAADAETLRRGAQTIVNQVSALKAMVDDFRDYARLPAPVLARLDLNALVSEVLSMYETSSVPIRRKLGSNLPQVLADSAQIRQVLHNLVQNAQDALGAVKTPASEIEIRTEPADDAVRLVVSDNGGGFPEDLMARIFEPYVTTKPRGTGLGLAIVKKIVDEHHGEIAIENRPRQGASVSILLPVPDGASAKAA